MCATHRVRVVSIEPSMDCPSQSLVREELDRVDDDSKHGRVRGAMASERADVRDLSGSLRCVPASPASIIEHLLHSKSRALSHASSPSSVCLTRSHPISQSMRASTSRVSLRSRFGEHINQSMNGRSSRSRSCEVLLLVQSRFSVSE